MAEDWLDALLEESRAGPVSPLPPPPEPGGEIKFPEPPDEDWIDRLRREAAQPEEREDWMDAALAAIRAEKAGPAGPVTPEVLPQQPAPAPQPAPSDQPVGYTAMGQPIGPWAQDPSRLMQAPGAFMQAAGIYPPAALGGAAEAFGKFAEKIPAQPSPGLEFLAPFNAVFKELGKAGASAAELLKETADRNRQQAMIQQGVQTLQSQPFWEYVGETGDFVGAVSYGVAENLPVMITMLGLASVTGGATISIMGAAGAVEGGAAWNEAKENDATDDEALTAAGIAFFINGALEGYSGAAILRNITNAPLGDFKRWLTEFTFNSLREGVTETAQEWVSEVGAMVAYAGDEGLSWEDFKATVTPEKLAEYSAAGIIGTATAFGVQAPGAPGQMQAGKIEDMERLRMEAAEAEQARMEQIQARLQRFRETQGQPIPTPEQAQVAREQLQGKQAMEQMLRQQVKEPPERAIQIPTGRDQELPLAEPRGEPTKPEGEVEGRMPEGMVVEDTWTRQRLTVRNDRGNEILVQNEMGVPFVVPRERIRQPEEVPVPEETPIERAVAREKEAAGEAIQQIARYQEEGRRLTPKLNRILRGLRPEQRQELDAERKRLHKERAQLRAVPEAEEPVIAAAEPTVEAPPEVAPEIPKFPVAEPKIPPEPHVGMQKLKARHIANISLPRWKKLNAAWSTNEKLRQVPKKILQQYVRGGEIPPELSEVWVRGFQAEAPPEVVPEPEAPPPVAPEVPPPVKRRQPPWPDEVVEKIRKAQAAGAYETRQNAGVEQGGLRVGQRVRASNRKVQTGTIGFIWKPEAKLKHWTGQDFVYEVIWDKDGTTQNRKGKSLVPLEEPDFDWQEAPPEAPTEEAAPAEEFGVGTIREYEDWPSFLEDVRVEIQGLGGEMSPNQEAEAERLWNVPISYGHLTARDVAERLLVTTILKGRKKAKMPAPEIRREAVERGLADPMTPGANERTAEVAGEELRYKWQVVNLDALVSSHDQDMRARPEADPSYQHRQRGRKASRRQLQEYWDNFKAELLGDNPVPQLGAPWVNRADAQVMVGHLRSSLLQKMYAEAAAEKPGAKQKLDSYLSFIEQEGKRLGLDSEEIYGAADSWQNTKPVLVRVLDTPPADLPRFLAETNVGEEAQLSGPEQALQDANRFTGEMLEGLHPSEKGTITMANSGTFIQTFSREIVSERERDKFMDAKGELSTEGMRRVRNAVLAYAYQDPEAVARMIESTEDKTRRIGNAMLAVAPRLAKLHKDIQAGTFEEQFDLAPALAGATNVLSRLRNTGTKVADYLRQTAIGEEEELDLLGRKVLAILGADPETIDSLRRTTPKEWQVPHKSTERLARMFNRFAELVETRPEGQAGLFGAEPAPGALDLIEEAARTYDKQAGLFEEEPGAAAGVEKMAGPILPLAGTRADSDIATPGEGGFILPELVELAQEMLDGKYPIVKKRLRKGAYGLFRRTETEGEIQLGAGALKTAREVALTLGHEIGHVKDWLPDKYMERGNILGRIAKLHDYGLSWLEKMPDTVGPMPPKGEMDYIRSEAKRRARSDARAEMGFKLKGDAQKAFNDRVNELTRQYVSEEASARGFITKQEIIDELHKVSESWRGPVGESAYRRSSKELYADAFTVFVNDPAALSEMAPVFTESFLAFMERNPRVYEIYLEIRDRALSGQEPGLRHRWDRYVNAMSRQEIKQAQAINDRAKKGRPHRRSFKEELADDLIDVRSVFYRLPRDLAKKHEPNARAVKKLIYQLEERGYMGGPIIAYLDVVRKLVINPLRGAEIDITAAGAVMALRRAATERAIRIKLGIDPETGMPKEEISELMSPLGEMGEYARELMEYGKELLGEHKADVLMESLQKYWEIRQADILPLLRESEALSDEVMEMIEANPFYARYTVSQYIIREEAKGGGMAPALSALKEQIGTFQEIGNPLIETMSTDMALITFSKNTRMLREAGEVVRAGDPKNIRPLRRGAKGIILRSNIARTGWGTITYRHRGKVQGYEITRRYYDALTQDVSATGAGWGLWMKYVHTPVRYALVEKSWPFAVFNFHRDWQRFFKNVPEHGFIVSAAQTLKAMVKSAGPTYKFLRGDFTPEMIDALKAGALLRPGTRQWTQMEEAEVKAAQRAGELDIADMFFSASLPGAAKAESFSKVRWAWKVFLDVLGAPGAYTERWTKIAAWQYYKAHQQELEISDQEIAHRVRTRAGTPDVMRRGRKHAYTNSFFLFSNVAKEGLRGDWESMRSDPFNWWSKQIGMSIVAPAAVSAAAASGIFGDRLKEIWDKIPEGYKRNYLVIPIGLDSNGKAIFIPIPLDHTSQAMHNFVWQLFEHTWDGLIQKEKTNKVEATRDIISLISEVLPWSVSRLHPFLQWTFGAAQYGLGANPNDLWTGRPAIPRRYYEEGPFQPDSWRAMGRWSLMKMGGGVAFNFRYDDYRQEKTGLEKWLFKPGIGPVLRRFVRTSDYGLVEQMRKREAGVTPSQKKVRLANARADMIAEALAEDPSLKVAELHKAMLEAGIAYDRYSDLLKRIKAIKQRRGWDVFDRAQSYAMTKEEKQKIEEDRRKYEERWGREPE